MEPKDGQNVIRVNDITLRFGERLLFDNLSMNVPDGARVGLVGLNGSGKTTLLRILSGGMEPDDGSVVIPGRHRLGYLPQDLVELQDIPLLALLRERAGVADAEREMERLSQEISAGGPRLPDLLRRHEEVQRRFEALEGYAFDSLAGKVLTGLGFRDADRTRRCGEFSGGWKMRILLASILLGAPDILLLDEPTNHLDTESMEWLESWLSGFRGTMIAVAHDRRFLDRMCTHVAELENRSVTLYRGSYSEYLREREQRREEALRNRERQEAFIERTESFIERFRYKATKAAQVQSRIKTLEKIEIVEIDGPKKSVNIRFPECPRSGHEVVRVTDVGKSYGDVSVFRNVSFSINRGEKIALVGVNGAGKSTLSRLIARQEAPTSGEVRHGHNVRVAFFSQESTQNLDYRRSVWQEALDAGGPLLEGPRRTLLGAFLFSGDDIHKSVSVLSGGEKSRLALFKILLRDSNLLILDEPTNHLDMTTRELFQEALLEYSGTLVIVSHDRFFLDSLATRIIEIRNGGIRDYPGNYSYFVGKRAALDAQAQEQGSGVSPAGGVIADDRTKKRSEAERRNERYRRKRIVMETLTPLETEIAALEREQSETDGLLCAPDVLADSRRVQDLMLLRSKASARLDELLPKWESLMLEIEQIDGEDS